MPVVHAHGGAQRAGAHALHANRLLAVLCLVRVRVRTPVGLHEAVDAERLVRGRAVGAKVAAVAEALSAADAARER